MLQSNLIIHTGKQLTRFMWLVTGISLLLLSCDKTEYIHIRGSAQGTTYHITYQGQKNYTAEIDSILKAFDMSLSIWNPNSVISRINNNDPTVKAGKLFTDVFNKAREIFNESDGMFDITVGPLVRAWGFHGTIDESHDSAKIKKLLTYVGMNKVKLINGRVIKENDSINLDVNAIAQGYSVDIVASFLERNHIKHYLVEIGGELKAKGKNPEGKKWLVGIDKPVEENIIPGSELQAIVEISNKAMSTSGDYRKFIVENGVKYSHHINPKTGYPSKNTLLSATILANDCMTADGYGTACMVSGLEKSISLLQKHPELDGYLIYNDRKGNFQVYCTKGLKKCIKKSR